VRLPSAESSVKLAEEKKRTATGLSVQQMQEVLKQEGFVLMTAERDAAHELVELGTSLSLLGLV